MEPRFRFADKLRSRVAAILFLWLIDSKLVKELLPSVRKFGTRWPQALLRHYRPASGIVGEGAKAADQPMEGLDPESAFLSELATVVDELSLVDEVPFVAEESGAKGVSDRLRAAKDRVLAEALTRITSRRDELKKIDEYSAAAIQLGKKEGRKVVVFGHGGPLDRVVSLHSKLITCAAYRDYPLRTRYPIINPVGPAAATYRSHHGGSMIFVIGTGRSGTHFLGDVLKGQSELAVTVEKPPIFTWVKAMALDPSQQTKLFPKLVNAYEEERREVLPKRYADKSHPNIWIAEALSEVFPDAQFLGIERDPFGTVASMLKHKGVLKWHRRWRDFPIPNRFLGITAELAAYYDTIPLAAQCALRWRAHHYRLQELARTLGNRLMRIDYQELVTNTENTTRDIRAFLGLNGAYTLASVKPESLNRWRQDLPVSVIQQIRDALADVPGATAAAALEHPSASR